MLREIVIGIAFLFALCGVIASFGMIEKYAAKTEVQATEIIRKANENL